MKTKMLLITAGFALAITSAHAQSTIAGNGLSGTLPSSPSQFLGSSNPADVLFKSNNAERMRILSTGNIGIGTTTPTAALNIATTGATQFLVERTAGQINGLKMFFTSNPATGILVGAGSTIFQNTSTVSDMLFMPTPTSYSMVMKSSGFMGIGTTTPLAKLNVENGAIRITGPNPAGGPMILFGGSATTAVNGEWGIEYDASVAGKEGLNFWQPFGASGIGGNNFLFLGNNGRVGINTNNPTAQLTVNGNMVIGDPSVVCIPNTNYKLFVQTGILAEKVKVAINCTSNWSDYIFDKNYQLQSLKCVEEYITANKHLPNIPSADEVVNDGVDLGEMTSKLLGKVEELTLYIIEQNKKIEALQNEVNLLKKN